MPKVTQPMSADSVGLSDQESRPAQPTTPDLNPQNTPQSYIPAGQNPIGMSANSLTLKTDSNPRWPGALKKLLPIIILTLLAGAGGLFYKNTFTGLEGNTLGNNGYTYSVEFFKPSDQIRLNDGSEAIKHSNTILTLRPSDGSKLYGCSQIGNGWKETFKVKVYGQTIPVCRPSSLGNYTLYFTANDQRHLFSVTFKDTPSEEIHPTLKTIFESVRVYKQ